MDFEVDHVILLVQDLDRASADFEALGFTLTAKSSHPFGTANRLISLGKSFIELLSVEDAALLGELAAIKELLEATGKDTPWGVVWQMEHPVAMHSYCESLGMQPSPLQQHVTRKVVHPDGSEHEACYSSFALTKSLKPGYMEGFSIQHRPDATFAEAWRSHRNGGGKMTTVILETDSLRESAGHLAAFGEGLLSSNERNLEFGSGSCRLRVVPRSDENRIQGPALTALEVCMTDIETAKAVIHQAGVDYIETDSGTLKIEPRYAAGLELRLFDGRQF